MIRLAMLLIAGLITISAAPPDLLAQRRAPQDMGAQVDSIMGVYAERLQLTSEQEGEIRGILEGQGARAREMMESARGQGREAMMDVREKMGQLQNETSEQVEAVLTEDQIPEYREIQAELQEQRRSRMRQRRQERPEG